MIVPILHILAQLASLTREKNKFSYLLEDFLDAFYRCPTEEAFFEERALLAETHPKGAIYDAFLAATAQALAICQHWRAPGWAFEESHYLHRPFFTVNTANLRATLLLESPPAFRARNLIVSANALNRA